MKKLILYSFAIILSLGLLSVDKKPVKIFLAGDSTMADKSKRAYPETGWGMVLPSYFNDKVIIENHARNGRSTRTFISEGRWQFMLDRVGEGDYVVIQFGHNDQSKKKVDRYTSPEDYKKNLEKFVQEVRAKNATPILCTPVMRRKFDDKGRFVDQHGIYPQLVRQVAQKMRVDLIDMTHTSMDVIIEAGVDESAKYFLHVLPGECEKHPDGKTDNTHFKPKGALVMAGLFIDGLVNLNITPLVNNLKARSEVTLKNTTPIKGLGNLGKSTNHKLDEGNGKK